MKPHRLYKTALVCIAKNEDRHLAEWIRYHGDLGFTNIFIYQNNWRYTGPLPGRYPKVHLIECDGEALQLPAYNHFIDTYGKDFAWAAFFDCDEFLSIDLKKWPYEMPLQPVLAELEKHDPAPMSVGINWRFFGGKDAYDMNLPLALPAMTYEVDGHASLKKNLTSAFVNCEEKLDKHVKVMINLQKAGTSLHFINPHCVGASLTEDVTLSIADYRPIHGPWNFEPVDCGIQLNHYYKKTEEEFKEKIARGKADTPKSHPMAEYKDSDFYLHDSYPAIDGNAYIFASPALRRHMHLMRQPQINAKLHEKLP